MKVLFIGYLREASGWGQAARDYLLSLDAAGVDVVARCVHLGQAKFELPERIVELEAKSSSGCDVCVQHLLPHHMEYHGGFRKNVGLFVCETSNFRESSWADYLNLMDEVIVPCSANWMAAKRSGVTVPVNIVPHATDISRFQKSYEPLDRLKVYKDQGDFLFYCVGEWVRRKNMGALLRAFHTEFDVSENVQLVFKTNVPGLPPAEGKAKVEAACNEIKHALKLNGGVPDYYKKEIIITDRLTPEGMMKLHSTCDCFVLPSHGEAWAIPAFDAMAMGKTPIVTEGTCFEDYLTPDEIGLGRIGGWLVPSYDTQVFGVNDTPFDDLYTGKESWKDVSQARLQECMRKAYEDSEGRSNRAEVGREHAYQFTYEAVGSRFQKVLQNGQEIP